MQISHTARNIGRPNKLREKLEELAESGKLTILSDYDSPTHLMCANKSATTIDVAVTIGDWHEGFAHPIEIHLASSHLPIYIGIKMGERKVKRTKGINIPRYKRMEHIECTIKEQLAAINETLHIQSEDTLTKDILNAYKENTTDPKPKNKNRKQRHWWNPEIQELFDRKTLLPKIIDELKNTKTSEATKAPATLNTSDAVV